MRPITIARAKGLMSFRAEMAYIIEMNRYNEKIKMLPAPPRTEGGRRIYDGPVEARTLAFIRRARERGITLDDIRALLALGGPEKASSDKIRDIAAIHLDDIHAKMADLKKLKCLLSKTVAQCTGRPIPDCPVLGPSL